MTILLATRNRHKAAELAAIAAGRLEFRSLADYPALPETDEDQPDLEGNARKKAVEPARALGVWALAEDTGLEVEALGGAPGVVSARYAGPACSFADNVAKLLKALEGIPQERRGARFRTVMALSDPEGRVILEEGRLDGAIAPSPRGTNGFGYDPVFLPEGAGRTLAELSNDEKNLISHRRRAFEKILGALLGAAENPRWIPGSK